MPTTKANKGEWSEVYTFLKILSEHDIAAADMNLQPTKEKYTFLQLIREDTPNNKYIYDIKTDDIVKIFNTDGEIIKTVDVSELPEKTKKIFNKIKKENKPAFAIKEATDVMNDLLIDKIKANSSQKADIIAVIKDKIAKQNKPLGFSIKSQVGGASTLLNAGRQTNFIYKINGFNGDASKINSISTKSKIRDRLQQISEAGGVLEFSSMDSPCFSGNLRIIDTVMPQVIAGMLVDYYSGNASSMHDLCKLYGESNPFDINEKEVTYKVKTFLRAIALGMVPSKEWDTYLAAYGGYIVVRDDGMLLCYYLYNDDDFRNYLFNNTKFDTPSSKRHEFGSIYSDTDGQLMIKLNLQIRFSK